MDANVEHARELAELSMKQEAGADITIQNNAGKTAMDLCAKRGFTGAIELMMGQ